MYSKDDLLSKDISELVDIAKQLGAKCQPDDTQENIAYAILDAQAENPAPVKRKRTRITKKDTDHVRAPASVQRRDVPRSRAGKGP